MKVFPAAMRDRIKLTLSGQTVGTPEWVLDMEKGTDAGFFGPGSATWGVHGGMSTIVAGTRALLLQALHPGALAGVHDWSRYKEDPLGRLTGTIRWIYTVSYGDTEAAISASNWVLRLHERVTGTYPDAKGVQQAYAANDPDLLSWVHLAFTDSFLATAKLWGEEIPGGPDAYVAEWAKAGELMGVPNPPRSEAELAAQLREYLDSGILVHNDRVDETVKFIRKPPIAPQLLPGYGLLFGGAVASIPEPYRSMLGLKMPALGPIPVPIVGTVRLTLAAIGQALETDPPSEMAALRRMHNLGMIPEPTRAAGLAWTGRDQPKLA